MRERAIDTAFASLSAEIDGFEPRPPQRRMAAAVHRAMRDGGVLAVEAPTGVGKSLAYLVPAAIHASDRRRVIVSTHTKHLQGQIVGRDAPTVRSAVAPDVRVGLLKGRMNYVCLRRWQALAQSTLGEPDRQSFLDRVGTWLAHTDTGDLDELGLYGAREHQWSREFRASEDLETAALCARARTCFVRESRRRAGQSDIIVVNHALLLTHLLTSAVVLPEADAVIVDEAHALPEVAARILEHRASPTNVRAALSRLAGGADPVRLGRLDSLASRFSEERSAQVSESLARLRRALSAARTITDHFFAEMGARPVSGDARYDRRAAESNWMPASADAALLSVRDVLDPAQRVLDLLTRHVPDDEAEEELILSFASAVSAVGSCLASFRFTIEVPDDGYVYWREREPEPALVAVPLDPGREVAPRLLDPFRSVVLTSATLAADGDFGHFLSRMGTTPESTDTLAVESPFPLESQVLAVAPPMPAPGAPDYEASLADAVARIARATGRNTLVLLTSHRLLRSVRRRLDDILGDDVPVLAQGVDGDRTALSAAFRELRGGVLLGTSSFFEGVDFPGAELEVLVLTRLPFPVPADPLVAARAEAIEADGGSSFGRYMIPEAVLRFRQGFGRLIRRASDRGVFVILDSRIRTARYRGRFLSSIPVPVHVTESLDDGVTRAGEWFDLPVAATKEREP